MTTTNVSILIQRFSSENNKSKNLSEKGRNCTVCRRLLPGTHKPAFRPRVQGFHGLLEDKVNETCQVSTFVSSNKHLALTLHQLLSAFAGPQWRGHSPYLYRYTWQVTGYSLLVTSLLSDPNSPSNWTPFFSWFICRVIFFPLGRLILFLVSAPRHVIMLFPYYSSAAPFNMPKSWLVANSLLGNWMLGSWLLACLRSSSHLKEILSQ